MRPGLAELVTALALFAVAVFGWPSRRAVEHTYETWLRAHAERNPALICELTPADQRPRARVDESSMHRCTETTRASLTPAVARRARALLHLEVVDVKVDGDTATATLGGQSCTVTMLESRFQRIDGRWLYAGGMPTMASQPECHAPNTVSGVAGA